MKAITPKMVMTNGTQVAIAISEPNEILDEVLSTAETALLVLVARLDPNELPTEVLSEVVLGTAVTSIMSAAVAVTLLKVPECIPQVPS